MHLRSAAVLATLLGSLVLLPTTPANAADCQVQASWDYNATYANKGNCSTATVQARIERYVSNYPTTYLGAWGATSSVSASNGVNAGNAFRVNMSGATSPWNWIH
jgi:hypothetical protein